MIKQFYASKVKDPEVRRKLIPHYPIMTKRITPSDEYLETYNKPFVKLITQSIDTFTKEGIKTDNTIEYKVDAIIYATGFDLLAPWKLMDQIGADGMNMRDVYGDTPMAFKGCTHPNLPNFFYLLGPGTGLAHNSAIYMIECQVSLFNYLVFFLEILQIIHIIPPQP